MSEIFTGEMIGTRGQLFPEDMPMEIRAGIMDDRRIYGSGYARKTVDGEWELLDPLKVMVHSKEGVVTFEVME